MSRAGLFDIFVKLSNELELSKFYRAKSQNSDPFGVFLLQLTEKVRNDPKLTKYSLKPCL